MRISIPRRHVESGPNMTALVDITMVILIFLMLAGSFGGATHFLEARTRPVGKAHGPAAPATFDVDVRLSRAADGTLVARAGAITTANPAVLTRGLADQLEAYRSAGTDLSRVQVVLRPDRRVQYDQVIDVYQAVLRAGYKKVAFAATPMR